MILQLNKYDNEKSDKSKVNSIDSLLKKKDWVITLKLFLITIIILWILTFKF